MQPKYSKTLRISRFLPSVSVTVTPESSIVVFPDIAHSGREKRFIAVGKTEKARYIFMVFTLRDGEKGKLIRPISARYMHEKEVKYYEKTIANAKNR